MSTLCKVLTGVFVAALCVPVPQAQAGLVDRGGGMLYDTVLNVTWLQDANHAKTSGYDADGLMTWTQANTWANGLVYGGYSDWRLARNSPVDGTQSGWNYNLSFNGTTDRGYNITSTFSELSYMYYVNLGLKGRYNPDGTVRSDSGVNGNGTFGGQKDVGLVKNLQNFIYWSGTAYGLYPADDAWLFNTSDFGGQGYFSQSNGIFAWAVRPGDVTVAAVPVPGSVALLAGGLALLGVVTRRRGRLGASEA
jgi:hypothetical protein